ncbi:potassium channel family protein [Paraburkholderia franconis]|uniref:potassium channel family protein n=1 Tax=Paraburkholderia franconis TaxID=2654983 RepID=UPI00187B5474|nr:potassium channel family protein [Paraburkholderia franconis]
MNVNLSLKGLRGVMVSLTTMLVPIAAGFFVVHLSYSLLSPSSDAILDAVLLFFLALMVLMTSRRMILIVQLTALGFLLCMAIWTYSDIYMRIGIVDGASNVVVQDRESCLYFSIITFTTVGYGDFRPTPDGRMIAATEALTGYVFLGVFISMLSAYVAAHIHQAEKDRLRG